MIYALISLKTNIDEMNNSRKFQDKMPQNKTNAGGWKREWLVDLYYHFCVVTRGETAGIARSVTGTITAGGEAEILLA